MGQADDTVPIAELLDERQHLLDVARWMPGTGPEAEDAATEPDRALPEEIGDVPLNALDALSPAERAAFVLNDVFAVPPHTVADIVGRPPHQCAELADRARRSLRTNRAHPTTPRQHGKTVRAVRQACATTDTTYVVSLLSPHVTAFFDGGGEIRALTKPVHGNQHVASTDVARAARQPGGEKEPAKRTRHPKVDPRATDSGGINAIRGTLDRLVGASRVRRTGRGLYRAG